ncbi:FAD-dependent monooxygenase [Amycolatopsis sp. lyj-84]|uniref:FAD-dependent monooxygenase n=1 Tax=Amycolatopsis sp. lyj-84 TaxID=2789284 RepID=UPI003978C23B
MRNRRILISGAGIAGPALAYWLRRHGFDPTVVERAPTPRRGGQAVDVRGVAIDLVERMGIIDQVRAAQVGTKGMSLVNATGKPVASLEGGFGVIDDRDVEILREDLGGILREAGGSDVEYLFGDSITALTQDEIGVEVTFERAGSRTFDLVIGADGLHSGVRALAFGEESRFVHQLDDLYLAIFTTPNHLGLDHWQLGHSAPGLTASITSVRDDTEARAVFFFTAKDPRLGDRDPHGQMRILKDTFAGMGWEVPRLMDFMPDAPDFYFDTMSQVRMDSWSAGRVALVGDAGYGASPLSGQGTSLALVGAYVLAGELAAADGDHPVAFARYAERMRNFVELNQKLALGAAKHLAPKTRAGVWLQRANLRMLRHLPWKDAMIRAITKEVREASVAIELKDYRRVPA